jgi:probable rRNA maturation factor
MVILEKRVAGIKKSSLGRFVVQARRAAGVQEATNVLVTNAKRMRRLNRQFRGKDKPTDVLSFPSSDGKGLKVAPSGEIAICGEIAEENAERFGHSPAQEVKILILHGMLHLAGFDHERDNGRMARKEAELRRILHLPTGLLERVHNRVRSSSATRQGRKSRQGAL